MPRKMRGRPAALCVALSLAGLVQPTALAQTPNYSTMASQPDPLDFVRRSGTRLTLQDTPLRFGGVNITWLGLRQDGAAPARRPTPFEVQDALATARALGAAVVRVPGLVATGDCALCVETAPGQINPDALAQVDLVLTTARDMGLKLILPLADSGAACASPAAHGVICTVAAADPRRFFADSGLRAAFLARVQAIVSHVNARTGAAYADDPTILAWEDCDACAGAGEPDAVAGWVEAVGEAVKAADKRHLFESGAFAGRIGRGAAHKVAASLFAIPSVDIVGDRPPIQGDAEAVKLLLADTAEEVGRAERAYVLDDFGWAPPLWQTQADLEGWLTTLTRERDVAGAMTGDLQAHADAGGYLPPAPSAAPGVAALYFPGHATPAMDLPAMQARVRALRRFNYALSGVAQTPAYLLPPKPEILSTAKGLITWRGAAGAANYSIERSADPALPNTWTTLCDACATDETGSWQDPEHVDGTVWYRVMPFNINGHRAVPSAAVERQ